MTAAERAARDQEIERAYTEDGRTLKEIADTNGMTASRVQQILAGRGCTARSRAGVPTEAEQKALAKKAARLYIVEKLSQREIAKKLGVSKTGARDLLQMVGVEFRPAVTPKDASLEERNRVLAVLYGEGASSTVLSRVFSLTPERIRGIVEEAGMTLRSRGSRSRMTEAVARERAKGVLEGPQHELPLTHLTSDRKAA